MKSEGLTFLCEMGLDPGIDHLLAIRAVDHVRDRGGKVWTEYCFYHRSQHICETEKEGREIKTEG